MNQLRQLLGRRLLLQDLINPANYVLFLPAIVITSVLANGGILDLSVSAIWFLANLVAVSILYLLMSLVLKALMQASTPITIGVPGVIGVGFLLGVIKNGVTFSIVWALDGSLEPSWVIERMVANGLLGPTLSLTVALIIVARESYRAQRDLLISHRVMATDVASSSATNRVMTEMVAQAAREISRARDRLRSGSKDIDLAEQAKELRLLAELTVRPLSHRIWDAQAKRINDFSLAQLLRLGLVERPFAPILLALAAGPGLSVWVVTEYQWLMVLTNLIPTLAVFALIQLLAQRVPVASLGQAVVRFGVTMFLMSAFGTFTLHPEAIGVENRGLVGMFLALIAVLVSNSLMLMIFKAGIKVRAELSSELEAAFGTNFLGGALSQIASRFETRRVAQLLHSDVQNRLLSKALELERDGSITREELEAELSAIEALVLRLTDKPVARSFDLKSSLETVVENWQGFMDNQLSISGDITAWDANAEQISQAVNEALANAKRHGEANNLAIKIDARDQLEITIGDDGVGSSQPTPGLGFAIFSSITNGNFSFTPSLTGSTIKLVIPRG